MARKIFVIDTNVLMGDPQAIYGFDDNIVVVTSTVQQELDKHKDDLGEPGYNARQSILLIDELCESYPLDVMEFPLENSGVLRLYEGASEYTLSKNYDAKRFDNLILNDIKVLQKENLEEVILVTNDRSMRTNARTLKIKAQPYKNAQVIINEKYTGRGELDVDDEIIVELKRQLKNADNADYGEFGVTITLPEGFEVHENQYFVLSSKTEDQKTVAQYRDGRFYPIDVHLHPMNINQRNIGQGFALHALMAPVDEIPLVILEGRAGTAKTFLSLAAGLDSVYERTSRGRHCTEGFSKLVFTRPNQLSDRDHGFLKGDLFEKMTPLLGPAFDNLEQLIAGETGEDPEQVRIHVEDMFEDGIVEALSMAYMRGRSISNAYIIVDEAQNCTRGQIYDIISRAGAGTKVVLCGDSNQVDNPVLDKRNNGLVFAIERMKDSKLCAQVTFDGEGECVRSELAAEATRLLSK